MMSGVALSAYARYQVCSEHMSPSGLVRNLPAVRDPRLYYMRYSLIRTVA